MERMVLHCQQLFAQVSRQGQDDEQNGQNANDSLLCVVAKNERILTDPSADGFLRVSPTSPQWVVTVQNAARMVSGLHCSSRKNGVK